MSPESVSADPRVIPPERLSEFWREIYPAGMTVEEVCNELHDLEFLAREVPLVYDHVTGGMASKANTHASAIIALHDRDDVRRLHLEGMARTLARLIELGMVRA